MATLTIGPAGEITLSGDFLDHLGIPDGGEVTAEPLHDGLLVFKRRHQASTQAEHPEATRRDEEKDRDRD